MPFHCGQFGLPRFQWQNYEIDQSGLRTTGHFIRGPIGQEQQKTEMAGQRRWWGRIQGEQIRGIHSGAQIFDGRGQQKSSLFKNLIKKLIQIFKDSSSIPLPKWSDHLHFDNPAIWGTWPHQIARTGGNQEEFDSSGIWKFHYFAWSNAFANPQKAPLLCFWQCGWFNWAKTNELNPTFVVFPFGHLCWTIAASLQRTTVDDPGDVHNETGAWRGTTIAAISGSGKGNHRWSSIFNVRFKNHFLI